MKMKNILYMMVLFIGFSACKKDRVVSYEIEKSFPDPAVRFEDFKKAMATGTDGFQMIIETTAGPIYAGYIKLDGSNNAKFVSDNNVTNATTPKDTKYTLAISQTNSVLSFSKTGNFSLFAAGIAADTSYTYKMSVGDTLKLSGNATGTKLKLVKVTKAVGDDYLAGKMGTVFTSIDNLNKFKKYFKRLTTGGKSYDIMFDIPTKSLIFMYSNGTDWATFKSKIYYTNSGVVLTTPFVDGANKISSIENLAVDVASSTATLTSGGAAATLTNEISPVAVNKTAAATFISKPPQGTYAESFTGFTINGVADGLGTTSLSGFSSLDFVAKVTIGTTSYSSLRLYLATGYYGYLPAFTCTTPADGKLFCKLAGYAGTSTNATITAGVVSYTTVITQAEGFYVIPTTAITGANTYDLVNARDATAWISFH